MATVQKDATLVDVFTKIALCCRIQLIIDLGEKIRDLNYRKVCVGLTPMKRYWQIWTTSSQQEQLFTLCTT